MNLFTYFQAAIGDALKALVREGALPDHLDFARVSAEAPRDATHGDVATNAAMVLAKPAAMPPRKIADLVVGKLKTHPDIDSLDIAGPGFINLKLKPAFWPRVLNAILDQRGSYGRSAIGKGKRTNVEFVSANPTGPLHVGHVRGAVFGDALASLLKVTGYEVVTEYYINDAGAQIDVVGRSAYLRYREARGEAIGEIPPGLYPGDYLKPVGEALSAEHGDSLMAAPESVWLPICRDKAVPMMLALIREDLKALNIHQEVFTSEQALHQSGELDRAFERLKAENHIYVGRLPPPKGEVSEDWEDRDQTLFRTTAFGDDIDRPLKKSDGSYTYFASDVAYSANKIARGFNELVYVLGADHGGYVRRLEALGAAMKGNRDVDVIVRLCQLVKLYRKGEPVRMSKRAGDFVTLREVVDEVGPDVVRFMMLYRKNEAPLDFDFAKVTEQSKDNPVFYVQYAHARICSVLRQAGKLAESKAEPDFALLSDEAEIALIRKLAAYPRLLESAAQAHEPHRVAFYLAELAGEFHSLWNKGKESPHLRFIAGDDTNATISRLAFLRAIRYVLSNGLGILGVSPVEEM